MPYTQTERLIHLETPLGADVLLPTAIHGREELSRLFRFDLEMFSESLDIAARDIVGKPVKWSVTPDGGQPRAFHGIVRRFAGGSVLPAKPKIRIYHAEVVPWLWLLTQTADSRIFQEKTALDIVEQVFSDLGLTDFETSVDRSLVVRTYCVQYRESDFAFVSRLLEEEGIFYWFRHEGSRHVMVLADSKSAYQDVPETPVVYFPGSTKLQHLASWRHAWEYRSGKFAQRDWDFEKPSIDLTVTTRTVVDVPGTDKYEVYEQPGLYVKKPEGEALAQLRMEEIEATYDVIESSSHLATFHPGGKFTLEDHEVPGEKGKSFAITAVEHSASDRSYRGDQGSNEYSNLFTCIPDSVTFRPQRLTPRPIVQGHVTAVVTGPAGEEIYVDKYGRVKVQFHWDREGRKDEKTTCWVRVSQDWAGAQWGAHHWPRIGQEVIVAFLEGDPDRPIVVGRVYNADSMPPYALPDHKTRSGIKTRSTPKGSAENFNELRFEDKKGSEEIYFHAERNFNRVVENDDTLKVGFATKDKGDQTIEIYNDRTVTIEKGNDLLTVKTGNRTVKVDTGNDEHIVKTGNRTVKVDTGEDSLTVAAGSRTVKISTGHHDLVVSTGNSSEKVDKGNHSLELGMGNRSAKMKLGSDAVEAMQKIELKVGGSSVLIDQMGVTIKGMTVKIEGTMMFEAKGLMSTVKGDGMLTLKGAITMIN